VVHQPGHWTPVVASIALTGLVAAALLVFIPDGGRHGRDDGSGGHSQVDTTHVAYTEAVRRLGQSGSFAFRGSVHATGPSPVRPGTWLARDVIVEGAVLLPHAITREVAVAATGRAVETITSGQTAWSRIASTAGGLAHAPWEMVVSTDSAPPGPPGAFDATRPNRLGVALLADVVRSSGNRRSDPSDAAGPRTLHAEAPLNTPDLRYGELLAGAEVSLALDQAGNVDHIVVTSAPVDDPQLVVRLAIERLGQPALITPAEIGDPARGAVPVDLLEAAGVEALELGQLPAGWALTDARTTRDATLGQPEECPWLRLDYHDLGAVSDGWLSLAVTSDRCRARIGRRGIAWGEPFRAGSFSGRAEERWASTSGTVSDGVTTVSFNADLSAADTAVVLASLGSFDAETNPVPIGSVPSGDISRADPPPPRQTSLTWRSSDPGGPPHGATCCRPALSRRDFAAGRGQSEVLR
jgi:hypothetical protein